ncbi:MAG: molybdopterin-guanine dinucleotide biosynthesis protein B [Clostridia bacterium]|jgi:molybdopterin-guanine dinucleotide biosynthesis protein B|nr:molybdopterin-guanine dinucleotide biosynthesis protein B [Clostridiales bacterium]
MRIFSVFGITQSGKTTTIENIIRELKKRRYSVGSVKEIHFEQFAIDKEGTNTYRHRMAGSELVTARGYKETDILFQRMLSMDEILKFYHHNFVVLEGVTDCNVPKIVTAHNTAEVDERLDDTVFAISGRIANDITEYKGIPVISAVDNIDGLVDLIEEKVFEKLPDFPPECCSACGFTCRELGIKILRGEAKREDCVLSDSNIKLFVDGREIDMVPFVQKILFNSIEGVVKELEGYKKGATIEIRMGGM